MSRIETRYLENRPHFVVPMVMLTVGVHSGSNGPLFYPPEELERSVPRWAGIPVVAVGHPVKNGQGVSAMSPEVFSEQKVGYVFNTAFDGFRLTADAWLDKERLQIVDPALFDRLNRGDTSPAEISTGLFTSNTPETGTFNGAEYIAVARVHVPDHLAILRHGRERGACSIDSGCGLLVRNDAEELDLAIAF
jgi:hypothetical protein